MLEILEYFIGILTNDTTLNAIVPSTNIFVGPVDVTTEFQNLLLLPQINIHVVNESQRTVPVNTRDSMIQVDIWTRNNALEMETIYERVIQLLSYQTANIESNTAHVFWQKLSGGVDVPETDRRIWHKAMTFVVWSVKP